MLLSPEQFAKLTEYASYSSHKLPDMLQWFTPNGMLHKYLYDDGQTLDFDGFTHFLNVYFGADLPSDLTQQLFLSFAYPPGVQQQRSSFLSVVQNVFNVDEGMGNFEKQNIYESDNKLQQVNEERRPSLFEKTLHNVKSVLTTSSATQYLSDGRYKDNNNINIDNALSRRIPLKPLVCYLALLEVAPPEEKLQFVFHVYDSDDNGYLDSTEIECIIEQMMNVARYQQWDTIELEPILRKMMQDIDYDKNGIVSLEEWIRGGLTTIPLLVLLGIDLEMKEDGSHIWKLRHFSKPTYCHVCCSLLVGWGGKQGLACALCKYTVHERCVLQAKNNCIHTYTAYPKQDMKMSHHWSDSNNTGKCNKCKVTVGIFQGKKCRWCNVLLHDSCINEWIVECDLGPLSYHVLPPINIIPSFLDTNKTETTPGTLLQTTTPSGNKRPLLVLINPKSGGRQGERIFRKFQYLLNPRQVYNLTKHPPDVGLKLFKGIKNCNVLVAGGDGTVGWVLEAMDKMNYTNENRPPVAVLPLGTGNDLARCLKWGGGYENESLTDILLNIEKASHIYMDRWQITIEPTKKGEKQDPQPYNIINNYFSIGVDASIAHRFHMMREKYPEKFNSRMRNKLWYFELGTTETLQNTYKNLNEQIDILCDGDTIDIGDGPNLEGLALLNIPSIYGGSNMWGTAKKKLSLWKNTSLFSPINGSSTNLHGKVQDIGDKLIEVVGLESIMQISQIKAGVKTARRLAQCGTVVIQTHKSFPMQIDGEPWLQKACILQITHKNQVPMLVGKCGKKHFNFKFFRRKSVDSTCSR
uniref:Diacylglycerol kinase n=1 Tax=Strongyloides papillosus TaxID=174720 RepID=A0A0N5C455_STREA